MAVKIMETKTGEVIKTSKQVKRDRTVRKVQKYISVFAVVMLMLMVSAVTVFATGTSAAPATNSTPAGVDTSTMSQFGGIIWPLAVCRVLSRWCRVFLTKITVDVMPVLLRLSLRVQASVLPLPFSRSSTSNLAR